MESFNILSDRLEIKSKSTDDNVIEHLSMATGVVYSDEQLEIMRHRGGMAIMAAAGSGKTTVLTHLIAKRILSGEIADPSKILCTTYSKAGATEMEERINKLLATVGISKKVMVKTMHAFYLLILQHFGYSLKLVDGLQRTKFIREACSKAELKLKDEELQTLDSLLSYQVNNLMSDKELTQSYIYTLDEVPIEKYSLVKAWYTELKKKANMMDFDDMQLYVYFWLCLADENTKTAVKSWINQTWDEFYIDEAQDISKIQMAILRKMCTDSSKVVFIGDDDQCLVKGTKVSTPKGLVNIEDISIGDEVHTGNGVDGIKGEVVNYTHSKMYNGQVVVLKTSKGKEVKATPEHIGFARLVPNENNFYTYLMYKKDVGYRIGTTGGVRAGSRQEVRNGIDARVMQERADKAWLLKRSSSKEESLYWEAYFAYKYSIPMYRFMASDSKWSKTSLRQDQINRLFSSLNTEKSAKKLLSDLGMMFEYPHRVPQAEGDRCKLNHCLLSSSQVDKSGIHKSEISANSSNQEYVNILKRYLAVCERKSATKYNYFNARSTTTNILGQDDIIDSIVNDCKEAGIYLEVDKSIKLGNNKYMEINFGNIIEGMYVPVMNDDGTITDEEVISVEHEEYNDYVYDVSVPATRNFVANGVIVHNCIYEWRGADPSLLVNITGYYDIEKFILSTNYRCRAEIVNTAANGIKYNTKRTDKTMKPFNSGGQIKIINTASCRKEPTDKSPNIYTMTKYAFIYITDLIRSGVSPDKIAVLSRNNNQLSILNNMLFRDGVYCEFTKDMQFTGSQVYKEIKQVVELAKDEYEPQLTQSMLWKLVPYFSTANAKVMADFQANSGMKFSDVIGCFLEECCNIRINWEKPYGVSIPEASKGRLRALARNISENQANSLKVLYRASIYNGSLDEDSDKRKIENEYRRIANYLGLYSLATMGFLYKTEDKQRTCDGYVEYIKKMVKDWGIEKTLRFLNVSQQYESGAVSAITPRVTMSTIHGAKGKEWEHVVIFADDNITSPAFTSLNDMARKGVSTSDLHKLIEEDRRLHYVAMTRAKETLAIITYENNISTYTLEAFGLLDGLDELGIGSTMNEIVLNMAKCGKLRDEIVSKAKDLFFSENSKYKIEIDLSKVDKPTEIEFNLSKEQSKPKIDLNSAGISFSLSDDDEDDDTEQAKGSQALFAYEGMSLSLGDDDDDEEYYP